MSLGCLLADLQETFQCKKCPALLLLRAALDAQFYRSQADNYDEEGDDLDHAQRRDRAVAAALLPHGVRLMVPSTWVPGPTRKIDAPSSRTASTKT